jgi:ABC-type Zn uptake system ZnuABC Zn-binding protein ZnuA
VGALLATAMLVVPAATTRLWCARLATWQAVTVALVAVEGVAGLWLSAQTDAPPGATIAVVAGAAFALAALARALRPRLRGAAAPAVAVLAGALLLAGCGSGGAAGDRLAVVATTTQIADFARAVGGDGAHVAQLLQPNTDPHEYEPRPSDVKAVARAKVLLANGGQLDRWVGNVVKQSGGHPRVVDLSRGVPVKLKGDGGIDPHWWHDPRNAQAAVGEIRDALVAADPAHRSLYERNAAAYLARLRTLDRGIAACFAAIPPAQRRLVSNHDAFNYFVARYGIRHIGAVIPSQTTAAQPSAGDVARLIALIRNTGVKAIFPEKSVSPRLAESIARQTGATSRYTLFGDALGPRGSGGDTYLRMEQANADALVRGFTGGQRGCSIRGLS